jgi:MFS family permease
MAETTEVGQRRRALGRPFTTLWAGQTVSLLGDQITLIALPLLALRYFSASSFDVGLIAACLRLPFLAIGLPAGIWVTRLGLARSMIAADLIRGTTVTAAAAIAVVGLGDVAILCLLAVATGSATVFFQLSYQTIVPALIADEARWHAANKRLSLSESLSLLIGPALGGVIVAAAAPPGAMLIDSATYAVSVTALVRLTVARRPTEQGRAATGAQEPAAKLWPQIAEGWRYVRRLPLLNAIMWTGAAYNLGSAMYDAILVLFSVQTLHMTPGQLGLAVGVGGVGYPIGSLISAAMTRRLGLGPALLWAAIPSVLGLLVTAVAFGPWPQLFLAAGTAIVGLGQGCFAVNAITIRHHAAASCLRARATAVHRFASWGMLPIGALLGGAISQLCSVRAAMLAAVLCASLCAWPLLQSPLRTARSVGDINSTSN